MPQIEVIFDIDANGILKVTAQDKATGRSQHITITASSGLSDSEVERMRREAEAHAEEDRKRKDLVEARNNADNTAYQAEKILKEMGDKIPANLKEQVEERVKQVRNVQNSDDPDSIRKAIDDLNQVLQQVGTAAYQQAGPQQSTPEPENNPNPGRDEDVVDGEFRSE